MDLITKDLYFDKISYNDSCLGLGIAFDEELRINQELFQVVEVFLKKTKLRDVDAAVEKFCKAG